MDGSDIHREVYVWGEIKYFGELSLRCQLDTHVEMSSRQLFRGVKTYT